MSRPASSEEFVRWAREDTRARHARDVGAMRGERFLFWGIGAFCSGLGAAFVAAAYAFPGSVDFGGALMFVAVTSPASFLAVGLAISAGHRLRTLVPTPPSVRVTSTLDGGEIVREVHVGERRWTERHTLSDDEDGLVAVARHLVEDERVQAELAAGRLPEIPESTDAADHAGMDELLRSGSARVSRPFEIGVPDGGARLLVASNDVRSGGW